jgi:hypothetical protein
MSYPKCFDTKQQFNVWVEQSESDGLPDPRVSFCDSCSLRYQHAMIEENRCENPDYVIDEESEDIVDGESWNQVVLIDG